MGNPSHRICLWSGPRNVSTALMYSFAQRADTRVLDEPLYGHYLLRSGARHPGRAEVLAAVDTDGERVVRQVILGPCDRPVLFMKHMAHHLVDLDREFLRSTINVLLIRDPRDVLTSLVHQIPEPRLADTGLAVQCELLEASGGTGREPVAVVDSRELLVDPEAVLAQLCAGVGIDFDPAMLAWASGARPEDGVWAPYWYDSVHRSTGFEPYRPKREPLPERLEPLLEQCRPYYERLFADALRAPG